ncbi:MAG: glycosyl transferase family 2 [Candidatus Marinimicrobia bacterium]|nr:glycosyl transferase family 2 [Candidatus Neomarinimicrobiota bacterium]|tara:strand:- start:21266 stop:21976 length:711 start_codon:yes stop_codon:yes gene_type:complete
MIKLSIVIPCYNEEENIPRLLNALIKSYESGTEIILVNNGSTDNSAKVLRKELKLLNNINIRKIDINKNIGYGHGIMTGVNDANGEVISWTHADLQTDIKDVYKGYKIFIQQPDVKKSFLKGYRKKRPLIDTVLTWGMGTISSILLRKNLKEINAQPKIFHKSFLNYINKSPDDFSLDLYFYYTAMKNDLSIVELPVYFKERLFGEAKGGGGSSIVTRIKVIQRTLKFIFNLSRQL